MWLKSFKKIVFEVTRSKGSRQVGFVNLIKPAIGPLIEITPEQKRLINLEIDRKMQQLEDTGLSREQILLSKSRKGIPLGSDPFFQYLKQNYLARQIYIKAGERFTVEKVLEIALRQDIGPDPSYARTRQHNPKSHNTLSLDNMGIAAPRSDNEFNPDSYNAGTNYNPKKLLDELKPVQSLRYVYKPLEKHQKRKLKTRLVRNYDIHWRNIELITQFLSSAGNIRSRFATCLPLNQHKRMQRAIKAARSMFLIPHYGQILPIMNKNMQSLQEDVNELGRKQINLETGHLYIKRDKSVDHIEKQQYLKNDPDEKYARMMNDGQHYKLWLDSLKQELNNEQLEDKIKAELYARKLKRKALLAKGIDLSKQPNIYLTELDRRLGVRRSKPQQIPKGKEEEYKLIYQKQKAEVKEKLSKNIYNFAELLLKEKVI